MASRALALLAAALLAAASVAACGSEESASDLSGGSASDVSGSSSGLGNFAGYAFSGKVISVKASWKVPRILGGSRETIAATWIGAQGPGSNFIQIGTNEQRLQRPGDAGIGYFAFWSDRYHEFRPVQLFEVQPGDEMTAELHFEAGRWRLTIVDSTSGARLSFEANRQADTASKFALWVQEDVTNEKTDRRFAYPRLDPVRFRRLGVNARPPPRAELQSQLMSLPGRYLGPTPLLRDSFAVRRKPMSRAAVAYLGIADADEAASESFLVRLMSFSSDTSEAKIGRACETLSRVLERGISALEHRRWPAVARPAIDHLVYRLRLLLVRARAVPSAAALLASRLIFEAEATSTSAAARSVQLDLGLPTLKGVVSR